MALVVDANFLTPLIEHFNQKRYGFVRRNGKKFFRNYHRTLKDGRGYSLRDVWEYDRMQVFKHSFTAIYADTTEV